MIKIQNAAEDIVPLSDFHQRLPRVLERLESRRDPILITHDGRAKAALVEIGVFQELLEDLEVARNVISGLMAVTKGEVAGIEGVKFRKEAQP